VLNPGTYGLTVRKQDFTDYNKTVTLEQNQVITVKALLAEEKAEKKGLSLRGRIIYRYHNRDNPQRSDILGFAVSANYAVAVTSTSVVCFDTEGSVIF
jgi:hypothetical protein